MHTDRFKKLRKDALATLFAFAKKKISRIWRKIVKDQLRDLDIKDLYVGQGSLNGLEPPQIQLDEYEGVWTWDYVFENEWRSFRTRKDRKLELTSMFHECLLGRRKVAVKVVDIFGNDTMKNIEVNVRGEK